jgi:hypothetical protein
VRLIRGRHEEECQQRAQQRDHRDADQERSLGDPGASRVERAPDWPVTDAVQQSLQRREYAIVPRRIAAGTSGRRAGG